MSILNTIVARQLLPALEFLSERPVQFNYSPSIESFLRGVSLLETGLTLGLGNPIRKDSLAILRLRALLSRDVIKEYVARHRLLLPELFQHRLEDTSMARLDDGAMRQSLLPIDYDHYLDQVSAIFTDIVLVADAISDNAFVRNTRLLINAELYQNREEIIAALQLVGNAEAENLSDKKVARIARMIESTPRLQGLLNELRDAEYSIAQLSVNAGVVRTLISDNFLPDATRLGSALADWSEHICAALRYHFGAKARRASLFRIEGQGLRASVDQAFYREMLDSGAIDDFFAASSEDQSAQDGWVVANIEKATAVARSELVSYARDTEGEPSGEDVDFVLFQRLEAMHDLPPIRG